MYSRNFLTLFFSFALLVLSSCGDILLDNADEESNGSSKSLVNKWYLLSVDGQDLSMMKLAIVFTDSTMSVSIDGCVMTDYDYTASGGVISATLRTSYSCPGVTGGEGEPSITIDYSINDIFLTLTESSQNPPSVSILSTDASATPPGGSTGATGSGMTVTDSNGVEVGGDTGGSDGTAVDSGTATAGSDFEGVWNLSSSSDGSSFITTVPSSFLTITVTADSFSYESTFEIDSYGPCVCTISLTETDTAGTYTGVVSYNDCPSVNVWDWEWAVDSSVDVVLSVTDTLLTAEVTDGTNSFTYEAEAQ